MIPGSLYMWKGSKLIVMFLTKDLGIMIHHDRYVSISKEKMGVLTSWCNNTFTGWEKLT